METKKEINILLLGETGVGKSTFINAFSNFINFDTLKQAEESDQIPILIGTKFANLDDEFNETIIQAKDDSNERKIFGKSQTLKSRPFIFTFGEYDVRIIDTPGIQDTEGEDQDKKNIENILKIINQFDKLHAICILMNPIENRMSFGFIFCFKSIFHQLHKSISRNIVFVYTHAKAVNYNPSNTVKLLKDLLYEVKKNPPHVEINFKRNNTFFIESEAFNALVCYKQNKMCPKSIENPEDSWNKSSNECLRMMNYIASLEPHNVHDTLSLNTTRRLVEAVVDPLAEITSIVDDNMNLMKDHENIVNNYNGGIDGLRRLMVTPRLKVELIKLKEPKMVCTSKKCVKVYEVDGCSKYVYEQSCCNPCTNDHVGWFWDEHNCKFEYKPSFSGKYCSICDCPIKDHKRISSENRVEITRKRDEELNYEIVTKEGMKRAVEDKVKQLRTDGKILAEEKEILLKSLAKFDFF
jgi:GTPase SAR1 family protein